MYGSTRYQSNLQGCRWYGQCQRRDVIAQIQRRHGSKGANQGWYTTEQPSRSEARMDLHRNLRGHSSCYRCVTAVFVMVTISSNLPEVQSRWSSDQRLRDISKREVTFADKGVNNTDSSQEYNFGNDTWKAVLLEKFKETDWFKDNKVTEPAYCFDDRDANNTVSGYFFCPRANEKSDRPKCCGPTNRQTCCQEEEEEEEGGINKTDLYTGISVAVAFVVSISLCLFLYCCCCQKRPEVHSGKLVWLRKSKNKDITMAEGGVDSVDQGDTELIGFTEKSSEDNKPSSPNGDTSGFASPSKTHVAASGQTMTVPLINIQASTPDA